MQTREILKQVKKLDITTKHLVSGLIAGNYYSVFKGQGIEFSEIREYRPGDDIRAIDWNVTARFNHPYIKEFIEERDMQVYLVLDVSGSSSFGNHVSKRQRLAEVSASLMFAALRNNDKIGVILFSDGIERFIPARKGKRHIYECLDAILSFEPKSNKTDLENTLRLVSKRIKRQSILCVVSDFMDEHSYDKPLKYLKSKHDVIAIQISDMREQSIPDIGLIELEDEETGEQILVDTSDKEFQKNYHTLVQQNQLALQSKLKRLHVDFIHVLSDQEYIIPLKKFFKQRRRRR